MAGDRVHLEILWFIIHECSGARRSPRNLEKFSILKKYFEKFLLILPTFWILIGNLRQPRKIKIFPYNPRHIFKIYDFKDFLFFVSKLNQSPCIYNRNLSVYQCRLQDFQRNFRWILLLFEKFIKTSIKLV